MTSRGSHEGSDPSFQHTKTIIKAKTFDGNGEVPSGFEMIGRKIAKKMSGFALSYQSSLKKCFLFCSIFPKGWEIEKQKLIELWMAEGFLQPSQRDDMESVGNMFFNVLLQNSLLQVKDKDEYGNVSKCEMHDLVHDLASSFLSNNEDGGTPFRYMFLNKESNPLPKKVAKHLHTLFLECKTSDTKFSNFECLHNLTLSDNKELLNSVRKMVHLRNLNISNTWIRKLHVDKDEECWSIIKAKTFDENGEVPSGFEMIGRQVAKRCWGLPLAANVVGGVLRSKSEEEWRLINENWLSDAQGGEYISKILKLSFDHLSSPSLKKCFTFCSVFPKGWTIVKEELIELWMAEGFLQPSRRDDMESVGDMYFNVLLQNSLLQIQMSDDYGNVSECVMHDLVHDLASSVLSNNEDGSTPFRYVFLNQESSPIPEKVAKHLRTLFLECETFDAKLSNFECLHNLTLSGFGDKEFPNSVRKMIHLRNLNISNTWIGTLPKWIGELHHLQTLRANIWNLVKLPNTLKYMFNLRHLHINSRTKLPAEIGRLTSLQTLPYFTVGKEKGYQIEKLGSLKNLKGRLMICNLEEVHDKEEAQKANMFQKPNLFYLAFCWSDGRENERNDVEI
ncbi:putative disease resistance protein RGA3 [Salvia splendens]|uniref:putative disease resistance protein RGA3 n=1 Tax=Salvia splendens TaxID=180675 RepID=UPI001C259745|nr:putative disease resistance protein RGA3 [Salvia splendens]